ncbi:PspA/IM30 family protein [Bradyrhizobium canariense]|uniref:Uncharacterized protein n=1 Tax=Bradyrhizobium canariense TaxID=255045 RepID=A0A1H2BBT8_9BRAD|nr:hypothetical protein [Bradyrhizobium canariense]SDT55735.1 hypothetical protein SAMN05444158_7013 [Bradyrhizobium canariense]
MQSTLNPKQSDPSDVLVIAPDVVLVAPGDKELSGVAHDAISRPWNPQPQVGSDFSAVPPVPPVDTTFRPADIHDVRIPGYRPSGGGRAIRAFTAVLLATCIGGAAIAWQSSGNLAKQMVAKWAPKFVVTSLLLPQEKPGATAQPTPPPVQAAVASDAPPQPAAPAQTAAETAPAQSAPESVAPAIAALPPESAQSIQSMARDLATAGQEIEQLKASVAQLKASQEQMSRDLAKASEAKASEARTSEAKVSERNLRPRPLPPPPRWAATPARRPTPTYPPAQAYPAPQAAVAPLPPPAAAPYVPPQATPQPLTDPELSSVPRPPMPVR